MSVKRLKPPEFGGLGEKYPLAAVAVDAIRTIGARGESGACISSGGVGALHRVVPKRASGWFAENDQWNGLPKLVEFAVSILGAAGGRSPEVEAATL